MLAKLQEFPLQTFYDFMTFKWKLVSKKEFVHTDL